MKLSNIKLKDRNPRLITNEALSKLAESIKRDPEFMKACDFTVKNLVKGKVGEVDGTSIVVCPSSYYIANFGFMIVHEDVAIVPKKFDMVRTLDKVQGIDGWVAEGRRYYDCFIPTNKGVAIRLHKIA